LQRLADQRLIHSRSAASALLVDRFREGVVVIAVISVVVVVGRGGLRL
jgi:hypothetical protein